MIKVTRRATKTLNHVRNLLPLFVYWFLLVTLVVFFASLPQNFGKLVGTYEYCVRQ